jgi:crossover junction endodeoxyribonuclease RuvC
MKDKIIFSIDPGSVTMGFASLRILENKPLLPRHFHVVTAGMIRLPGTMAYQMRLQQIQRGLSDLFDEYRPEFVVLERAFSGVNAATALKLGEVRGLAMCVAFQKGLQVFELTPAEVKRHVTGNGRASKDQVELAMKGLLNFERGTLSQDATDALAIGLTFGLKLMHGSGQGAVVGS